MSQVSSMTTKLLIGNIEHCDLPELGLQQLETRIDTGAKTSSLHVDHIEEVERDGTTWVEFDIHPKVHNVAEVNHCAVPLHDYRKIKSSNGQAEGRYVITTELVMGSQRWDIELTLTDRSDMNYLMLLGREAMQGKLLIDPDASFLAPQNTWYP